MSDRSANDHTIIIHHARTALTANRGFLCLIVEFVQGMPFGKDFYIHLDRNHSHHRLPFIRTGRRHHSFFPYMSTLFNDTPSVHV